MMIVLFHVLYLIGKYVYQSYRANKEKNEKDTGVERFTISDEDYRMVDPEAPDIYDEKKPVKFFPPAYVQRYVAFSNVLSDPKYDGKIRKVVDFGCSELGFLVYLKNTAGIEEILCVDIDRTRLEAYKERAAPLVCEYLNCRTTPLTIEICEGSVTDRDKKLENTDAVVCIELIEHLYPETLTELPYNIFGYIKPKVAVITTPNADFNVLFPNFSGFRNPDHKFEWTRQQFKDWADNVTLRYPEYSVTFEGICDGPEGTEHLGACSQMAIFHRHTEEEIPLRGIEGLYKTVEVHEYPYTVDNRSDEQKILDNAAYHIRCLSFQYEDMQDEVPLEKVLFPLQSPSITIETLRTILQEGGWQVMDRETGPVAIVPQLSSFSDYTGDQIWENGCSSADENDWDEEPGPPLDYNPSIEEAAGDKWNGENWDEDPSIIIPEIHPDVQDNTYLYNREDISSDYTLGNTENFKPEVSYRSHHSIGDINIESQFSDDIEGTNIDEPDELTEYNNPPELNETVILSNTSFSTKLDDTVDSFPGDSCHSKAQNDTSINTEQKLKRMLDFRPYMSVSRSSTSPEPYLLQTVKMDRLLEDNNTSSQNLSFDQWTLNNTFEESNATNTSGIDLRSIYLNTSYSESKDSDSENMENCCTKRSSRDHMQDTEKPCGTVNGSMSGTSVANSCISDNQPQFTSSPKIGTKLNSSASKQRSLGHSERLKPMESASETSLRSSSDTSVSTASSGVLKKWYHEDKKPMYQTDELSLKGGNDTADKSSDNTLLNSDSSAISLTLNEEKTANDEAKQSSLHGESTCETASRRDSVNICDKEVQLDEHLVKSKSVEFTCDDVDRKTESNFCVKEDTSATNTIIPIDNHEVSSTPSDIKSASTECSSNNAKDFTNVKNKSLDLSVCNKHANIQSSKSVLSGREQADYNLENLEVKYEESKSSLDTEDIIKPAASPDTPPKSWSPEVMDSGYPNSVSAQDMTPEYDLSSIAQDRISDSESPSVEEAPRLGILEVVEVENADLANNNRDGEGNNMIAADLNDLEDLQPLIDVLEDDLENENDIYVLENGFPMWLLRILEMANPGDFEIHVQRDRRMIPQDVAGGGDARYVEQDEGFDSSSSEEDSDLENNEIGNDDNSDASENAMPENIENENENENASNSDGESDQWATSDT